MINSRKIEDLHPYVAYLCRTLIQKCKAQGIEILITSTYRDQEYQTQLYAIGRTKEKNRSPVTNAKSIGAHGYRLAFDFCPMVNGKCAWGRSDLFNKVGQIGKSLGLEYSGDWRSFKEQCHLQYCQGLTTSQLRSGKRPKFPSIPKHDTNVVDSTPKPVLKVIMKGITTPSLLNCYPTPCTKEAPNGKVPQGRILNIYRQVGNWYLVNIVNPQWVKKDFVKTIK